MVAELGQWSYLVVGAHVACARPAYGSVGLIASFVTQSGIRRRSGTPAWGATDPAGLWHGPL